MRDNSCFPIFLCDRRRVRGLRSLCNPISDDRDGLLEVAELAEVRLAQGVAEGAAVDEVGGAAGGGHSVIPLAFENLSRPMGKVDRPAQATVTAVELRTKRRLRDQSVAIVDGPTCGMPNTPFPGGVQAQFVSVVRIVP